MEKIIIDRLKVWAHHGVNSQERQVGNEFEVSVTLNCDLTAAMASDDVADTVNYAEVVSIIVKEMSVPSSLLENVVYRIKRAITGSFPAVVGGTIRVDKLTPPISCQLRLVGVETCF
ncbi:MAG: dihydroneopterin aldolase [Ruminococcus flavefaciens]|nr:dihydroneopterin aldolase [Ruminococcus flavefaciens]